MNQNKQRPVFLDPLRIRMPATAVASFGHRVAGVLLFLLLPFGLYLVERSLRGPEDFQAVQAILAGWPLQSLLWLLLWAGLHHLLAGIRFLLIDIEIGGGWPQALHSARAVTVAAFAAAVVIGVVL